jgi:hypothetical protein
MPVDGCHSIVVLPALLSVHVSSVIRSASRAASQHHRDPRWRMAGWLCECVLVSRSSSHSDKRGVVFSASAKHIERSTSTRQSLCCSSMQCGCSEGFVLRCLTLPSSSTLQHKVCPRSLCKHSASTAWHRGQLEGFACRGMIRLCCVVLLRCIGLALQQEDSILWFCLQQRGCESERHSALDIRTAYQFHSACSIPAVPASARL